MERVSWVDRTVKKFYTWFKNIGRHFTQCGIVNLCKWLSLLFKHNRTPSDILEGRMLVVRGRRQIQTVDNLIKNRICTDIKKVR